LPIEASSDGRTKFNSPLPTSRFRTPMRSMPFVSERSRQSPTDDRRSAHRRSRLRDVRRTVQPTSTQRVSSWLSHLREGLPRLPDRQHGPGRSPEGKACRRPCWARRDPAEGIVQGWQGRRHQLKALQIHPPRGRLQLRPPTRVYSPAKPAGYGWSIGRQVSGEQLPDKARRTRKDRSRRSLTCSFRPPAECSRRLRPAQVTAATRPACNLQLIIAAIPSTPAAYYFYMRSNIEAYRLHTSMCGEI
jgi:hypothetical protein